MDQACKARFVLSVSKALPSAEKKGLWKEWWWCIWVWRWIVNVVEDDDIKSDENKDNGEKGADNEIE